MCLSREQKKPIHDRILWEPSRNALQVTLFGLYKILAMLIFTMSLSSLWIWRFCRDEEVSLTVLTIIGRVWIRIHTQMCAYIRKYIHGRKSCEVHPLVTTGPLVTMRIITFLRTHMHTYASTSMCTHACACGMCIMTHHTRVYTHVHTACAYIHVHAYGAHIQARRDDQRGFENHTGTSCISGAATRPTISI